MADRIEWDLRDDIRAREHLMSRRPVELRCFGFIGPDAKWKIIVWHAKSNRWKMDINGFDSMIYRFFHLRLFFFSNCLDNFPEAQMNCMTNWKIIFDFIDTDTASAHHLRDIRRCMPIATLANDVSWARIWILSQKSIWQKFNIRSNVRGLNHCTHTVARIPHQIFLNRLGLGGGGSSDELCSFFSPVALCFVDQWSSMHLMPSDATQLKWLWLTGPFVLLLSYYFPSTTLHSPCTGTQAMSIKWMRKYYTANDYFLVKWLFAFSLCPTFSLCSLLFSPLFTERNLLLGKRYASRRRRWYLFADFQIYANMNLKCARARAHTHIRDDKLKNALCALWASGGD